MTGGGVYPALAVLQTLEDRVDEILWVGSESGMENKLIPRLGIPFKSIPAAGIHGVGISKLPGNLLKLVSGYQQARKIIRTFNPDVFFSTGGYVAVPVGLAAQKIPSVIFVPDVEPGLALKVLARSAERILISTDESGRYFKQSKKITLSGYPLRRELTHWNRDDGRAALNLQTDLPAILVFGGSKGAQSINRALYPLLPEILQKAQVVHISGQDNWEETQQNTRMLKSDQRKNYHPFPYLHENMGAALASADLVVCRAGASTLGELPYFNLPAILVPYPYAWRYQKTNADHLVKAGGALLLRNEDLKDSLQSTIMGLLADTQRLKAMKAAMQNLSIPTAAETIAEVLLESSLPHEQKGAKIND